MGHLEILRKAEIFEGLTDDELNKVDRICDIEVYEPGAIIFNENDEAKKLYIVESGRVSIRIEIGPDRYLPVFSCSEGCVFGWSPLVPPYQYTAGAKCMEKSTVVAIDGAKLRELCHSDTHLCSVVMAGIARLISSRLRNTRLQVASIIHG